MRTDSVRSPRPFVRSVTCLLLVIALAAYFAMAVSASRTKSPTFDEIVHITAGYNAWVNHDQRFDPGNGDFVKRWATIPLLFSDLNFPPRDTDDWRRAEFFSVSRDFMFHAGNDPTPILAQTRLMVALLGVALGAAVFLCSRQLFGNAGAIISLTLFAFCPHMLAHGALVSTDLALSFALLTSTWMLWRLLHVVSWRNLVGSLLAFSLLVISKMSAVLIAPIAVLLIVARLFNREPWSWRLGTTTRAVDARGRQLLALAVLVAAHAFAGWTAIWAVFEFKYVARAEPAQTELALMRSQDADVRGPIDALARFCHEHRLLPEGYLKGMEELVGISARRPSFMNGEWKAGGQASFFPYAFWVKTPPALLILLLLGVAAWAWRAARSRDLHGAATGAQTSPRRKLYEAMPLFILCAVYAFVAIRQQVNIGHRHILPLYPPLYILAGSAALLPSRRRLPEIVLALLLGWAALESLAVRPHYLAYFSPVAGGSAQGYRRLADSSLDWGQDLPGLKRWTDENRGAGDAPLFLSYFGTGIPEHYGLESRRLPGFPEWREHRVFAYSPGVYAISATMFQQLYAVTFGPWNRAYEDDYQAAIRRLGLTPANSSDTASLAEALQQHPDAFWQEGYSYYEKLRFARLCAWLRATDRPPNAQVGYSILIWKLDERALHDALWGEPLELRDEPVVW